MLDGGSLSFFWSRNPYPPYIARMARLYGSFLSYQDLALSPLVERSSIVAVVNTFLQAFFVTAGARG